MQAERWKLPQPIYYYKLKGDAPCKTNLSAVMFYNSNIFSTKGGKVRRGD